MINGMETNIGAQIWINSLDEGNDDPEVEMADGSASIELTDVSGDGEIAIHFTLDGEAQALVSIYVDREAAIMLGPLLTYTAHRSTI